MKVIFFLLKEITGAFDGARTQDWQASTNYESDALPAMPRRSLDLVTVINTQISWNFSALHNSTLKILESERKSSICFFIQ